MRIPKDSLVLDMGDEDTRAMFAAITGIGAFFITWIACTINYGFLLGFGLGWIPALIIGWIAVILWPLIWLGILGIGVLVAVAANGGL